MSKDNSNEKITNHVPFLEKGLADKHYKDLWRKNIIRLSYLYLTPWVILFIFFQYQFNNLKKEGDYLHLTSIAENKAKVLDLFLKERLVNLLNLVDDPKFELPPRYSTMESYLERLQLASETFTDIDFFDSLGVEKVYAGPLFIDEERDFSKEKWFKYLKSNNESFIITDIYLGFRKKPHFTIAVSKIINNNFFVLRATLDPQKIYDYLTKNETTDDICISLVNKEGYYQLVSQKVGQILKKSPFQPDSKRYIGINYTTINNQNKVYAFSWLKETKWIIVVTKNNGISSDTFLGMSIEIIVVSFLILLILIAIIFYRAKKIAIAEKEKDIVQSQLGQAAKLASVGELASGIAHEINNPLAIIASETGLIKDMINPEFQLNTTFEQIEPHLDNIHDATFRCRDITRKLLSFVRVSDITLKKFNINETIEDMVVGFFEKELTLSNIEIERKYCHLSPVIITDINQFKQVLMNIINNAKDAITGAGKIIIETEYDGKNISISISDTGKGISKEEMSKIFLPFYTTKEVGKGTGLGLPVSYSIIKNLGGKMNVESIPGKGTTFKIVLPANN